MAIKKLIRVVGDEVTFKIDQTELNRLATLYSDLNDAEIDVEYIDPRSFSIKQRGLFFTVLGDISRYSGEDVPSLKDYFYDQYYIKTFGGVISMSDISVSTMSEATLMLEIVIEFVLTWHVPINEAYSLLPKSESYWGYFSCKYRSCMVCGKKADIHHVDTIGMGGNRTKENHLKHHFMALCRTHHREIEQIGRQLFADKYHVPVNGIRLDLPTLNKLNIQGNYEVASNGNLSSGSDNIMAR